MSFIANVDLTNFLDEMSHKLSSEVEENCYKRIIKQDDKEYLVVRTLDVYFPTDISDIILSYSTNPKSNSATLGFITTQCYYLA